jgi:hypothetical protein
VHFKLEISDLKGGVRRNLRATSFWWREEVATAVAALAWTGAVGARVRQGGVARWAMFEAGFATGAGWRERDVADLAMLVVAAAGGEQGREFGAALEAVLRGSSE